MSSAADVLGAIIAGGGSTRFGSPKALARVGGRRVVDRAADALRTALDGASVIAIVNDADLARQIGLPYRADVLARVGALAGLHAALLWARERGCMGVLAVGCDMPFLSPALLRRLLAEAGDHDAVIPESEGPRGVEPLCAYYTTACIDAIDRAVQRGDARMIGFHTDLDVVRLPIAVVRSFGDPAMLFMNLNTERDRAAADLLAAELP